MPRRSLLLLIFAAVLLLPIAALAQAMIGDGPPVDPVQLVSAFGARDWHIVVATLLGVVGWYVRVKTAPTSWAHAPGGALIVACILAVVGATVPLLSAHASWEACGITAGVTLLSTLLMMSNPSKAKAGAVGLGLLFLLPSCATIGPVICGQGQTLHPPSLQACTGAFLDALKLIPGDVAACRVEPFSGPCIDAVISTVGELQACEPSCGPMLASGRLGEGASTVHVSVAVQRANIIQSLEATGHPVK